MDRAIALLWFYRQTAQFDERSASELAVDLEEEGFAKPHVSRLKNSLKRSRFTILSRNGKAHRINIANIAELDRKYGQLMNLTVLEPSNSILPLEWAIGKRQYLEKIFRQINGAYDVGYYDACAVLMRRMIESLIIEIYIVAGRRSDIQAGSSFLQLDGLISKITNDNQITLARATPKTMREIKDICDTAAHNRTNVTIV
ncbi:MAG: hypothetical protein RLP12_15320, partial [Ekhidna sp.]